MDNKPAEQSIIAKASVKRKVILSSQEVACPKQAMPKRKHSSRLRRHYKPSSIREWRCIGRENWQTRSAAMSRYCSSDQKILARCTYSESLLVKHGERSERLN